MIMNHFKKDGICFKNYEGVLEKHYYRLSCKAVMLFEKSSIKNCLERYGFLISIRNHLVSCKDSLKSAYTIDETTRQNILVCWLLKYAHLFSMKISKSYYRKHQIHEFIKHWNLAGPCFRLKAHASGDYNVSAPRI